MAITTTWGKCWFALLILSLLNYASCIQQEKIGLGLICSIPSVIYLQHCTSNQHCSIKMKYISISLISVEVKYVFYCLGLKSGHCTVFWLDFGGKGGLALNLLVFWLEYNELRIKQFFNCIVYSFLMKAHQCLLRFLQIAQNKWSHTLICVKKGNTLYLPLQKTSTTQQCKASPTPDKTPRKCRGFSTREVRKYFIFLLSDCSIVCFIIKCEVKCVLNFLGL